MDQTVKDFFTKNATDNYAAQYRIDHSPRIKAMLDRYGLVESLKGKSLVDVGGGLGFAGEMLDSSTDYWVIDGAEITPEQRLCKGNWVRRSLDHDELSPRSLNAMTALNVADASFEAALCLETLEHCGNPHHVLVGIKKLVKPNGFIYLSIPTETVWHNTPYPGLLWPRQNWEQFLGQMALPIEDFYIYKPSGPGWPAYQYKCRNAAWKEKRLAFPKQEEKFLNCTPIEATNL